MTTKHRSQRAPAAPVTATRFYTLTEAVAYTEHTIFLLRQHIYNGRNPALVPDHQAGRVLLFSQATLDTWLARKADLLVTAQGGRPPQPDQMHRDKLRRLSRARLAKLASLHQIDPDGLSRGALIDRLAVD